MDAARQFDLVAAPESTEAEARVRHAAGLHHLGLGDAEFLEAGLQPTVVQQGDLDCVVGRQRLGQQLAHALVDAVLFGGGAGPANFLAEPLLGGSLHGGEAAVRTEGGTSGKRGDRREQGHEAQTWSDHRRIQICRGESEGLHGIL